MLYFGGSGYPMIIKNGAVQVRMGADEAVEG